MVLFRVTNRWRLWQRPRRRRLPTIRGTYSNSVASLGDLRRRVPPHGVGTDATCADSETLSALASSIERVNVEERAGSSLFATERHRSSPRGVFSTGLR